MLDAATVSELREALSDLTESYVDVAVTNPRAKELSNRIEELFKGEDSHNVVLAALAIAIKRSALFLELSTVDESNNYREDVSQQHLALICCAVGDAAGRIQVVLEDS